MVITMAYGYHIKKIDRERDTSSVQYSEWTPRRGRRKSKTMARRREQQRMLFSLTMAAGVYAYPYGISEAAIVDKNGQGVTAQGNVYTIVIS